MHTTLAQVFINTLPEKYRSRAVIAGGAAADLNRANDIDIFVLGLNSPPKVIAFRHDLKALKIPGMELRDIFKRGEGEDATLCKITDSDVGNNIVVADIPEDPFAGRLPIQILASPYMTVTDLLLNFDLSCHCVAYTVDGQRHILENVTTDLTKPPKAVAPAFPEYTLGRYRRFCLRYGFKPDAEELIRLCTMPEPSRIGDN